jgi:probable F420-dependent oxidoreductase
LKPLDIWTGGSAPGAFRRAGRLADGWLGSFLTPQESRAAREAIQAAAAEAGREIEGDHFGISLAVATGGIPDEVAATVRQRRPEADPAALIADGWASARRMIEEYVAAGLTKFVVRPATASDTPGALEELLDRFAAEMLPLQN